MTTFTRAMS